MSDTDERQAAEGRHFLERVAGRWQIPLLMLAIGLLVAGIWRLRPETQVPTFEELYDRVVTLKEAELYPEANQETEALLNALERTPEERRRLHRLMAEIIFAYESGNAVHGPTNTTSIIEHSDLSLSDGESHDAFMHRMRALAWEWQQRPTEAVAEYHQAIEKGIDDSWRIRKRVIELRRVIGDLVVDELHEALNTFLAGADVPDDLRYWAAEKKIDLYASAEQYDAAEQFLAAHVGTFQGGARQKEYDYLRALAWYHVGKLDGSERTLRALRDQLVPGDLLYARSGWLLGCIQKDQERPEFAMAFFEEVIGKTVPGPYHTAAIFGLAEVLADTERFDESVEGYEETIRLTAQGPYDAKNDLNDVRDSATRQYIALRSQGRLPEAMAYLRIANRLAPPTDVPLQEMYASRLADLAYQLGESAFNRAEERNAPDEAPDRREAQQSLIEAGGHYLRLAKLAALNADRSTQASWRAFEAFDFAGERRRAADVLEAFLREHKGNPRVPKALLQLGRTYQVLGEYERAIDRYEQNLIEFPNTPYAADCLVDLANCFAEVGEMEKAEETLRRIVDRRPEDRFGPIKPEAEVYKTALFRLGDLHIRSDEFEEAIACYEEAGERYPDAPETDRSVFVLANAYRLSAVRIREDVKDKRNLAYKDELLLMHQERLERAYQLFDKVIERYRSRPESSLEELDKLYVKLSHFYRADAIYDLSFVSQKADFGPFARALDMYDRAAWEYQDDPIALSAYTQMINCHLRMGNLVKAKMTLHRARWVLREMSDEAFLKYSLDDGRVFWEKYLSWLERAPTFSAVDVEETG